MRRLIVVMVFAFAISQQVAASYCESETKDVLVGNSFYKGNELNRMGEHDLAVYAMGFVDAFSASTLVGATRQCYDRIRWCSERRTGGQFAAMVRKYLQENPANWHYSSNIILYNSIFGKCLKK